MSNAINEIIAQHFTTYGDADNMADGFTSWAWDSRTETIADLENADLDGLAYEVAYSVREGLRMTETPDVPADAELQAAAAEFLKENGDKLVARLKDSFND